MADRRVFTLPKVTDPDVVWACRILKLAPQAFGGADGADPRLVVLKSSDPLDVAACPGSGKTTLLVAKLAILARHWSEPSQGVCVLSHTNVARREIETRLGATSEGRRLLGYPHHVGTIHGFINTYVAIPWLRSQGYPIRFIDDDACCRRRWFKLTPGQRSALEKSKRLASSLKVRDAAFDVGDIPWGKTKAPLGRETDLYVAIRAACQDSTEEGYFCHDEMFVWAHDALDKLPGLRRTIRRRFPALFIDEVQDNSEAQSRLLHRIFIEGEPKVIRQRFGDMNQAIFRKSEEFQAAQTDPFPDLATKIDIPNSHRFGQTIAGLANPLAANPPGLIGMGPSGRPADKVDIRPVVFLFDALHSRNVIPSYARYLTEVFTQVELREGVFAAVGAVHKNRGEDNPPNSVGHYWDSYDHQLGYADGHPDRFLHYVAMGFAAMQPTGDVRHTVQKVAEGLLWLVRILNPTLKLANRRNKHRQMLELLGGNDKARRIYLRLVAALAAGRVPASQEVWDDWRPHIFAIGTALAGGDTDLPSDGGFLNWSAGAPAVTSSVRSDLANVYQYPSIEQKVCIKVGSIHSVKGETHTATLVLDTFFYKHHLVRLKPWLLGTKSGQGRQSDSSAICSSLKQHYVAMTRPTHLLCLAMRASDLAPAEIATLQSRKWRMARVGATDMAWL
jgi:DNA helicase II / ATP-dependent DNA helicase PcrA